MYYSNKIHILKDIFDSDHIELKKDLISVNGTSYPIVDDVIILLDPSQYSASLKKNAKIDNPGKKRSTSEYAEEIQYTFGKEWQKYPRILPEYEKEFWQYFDLVDLSLLEDIRVCDLGCGNGRWSYFLFEKCRELLLVDFSESIFVARRNLSHANNALFFMADLRQLPFRENFADFLFCLGVLHHLPTPSLEEVRVLKGYAPQLLIYLYYTLDNRPLYFKPLLQVVDIMRRHVSRYRNPYFRTAFTWFGALSMYMPLIFLGALMRLLGLSVTVPLYEVYHGKRPERIRQDVYDRFFTAIEQRHSKKQIMELEDTFSQVRISDRLPFWHFICER